MSLLPIGIVVPVLQRPHHVAPLMANVAEVTTAPYRLLFMASPHDNAEHAALEAAGADWCEVPWMVGRGDFARKVNLAYRTTDEPLLLMIGDDVVFHPGWDKAAQAHLAPGVGVIGTQDLGSQRVLRGVHSCHPIVVRSYIDAHGTIDEPGKVLHEGYWHNFCDDELIGTAKHRDAWTFANDSVIEHFHPAWGKGVNDDTYSLGLSRFRIDRQLFRNREHLWT